MLNWSPVFFALGVVFYCALPFEVPVWGISIALIVAAGWAWCVRGSALWGRVVCAVLLCVLGCADALWETRRQPDMPALPTRAVTVVGEVQSVDLLPERDEKTGEVRRLRIEGAVFDTPSDAGMPPLRRALTVRLRADDKTGISSGQRVSVRALLHPPQRPAWPGGRDMQREAWFSGLAGSGYALGGITVEGHARGAWLRRMREAMADRFYAVLPGQSGAIVATVMVGESARLSPKTRQDFAASGLAHLLAVAGLHLGLVMGSATILVRAVLVLSERAALCWPCKEIAVIGGFVLGAVYVALTGAHVPSVRALGMAGLFVVALLSGRRVMSMRSLSVIAMMLLVVTPHVVLDVSFQMSFAAVMGLIAGYEGLRAPLLKLRGEGQLWRRGLVHVVMLALTSLLAGLATLPVSMAHFGTFQPWFVCANMVAVPLMAVWVMPAGIVSVFLMPFHMAGLPIQVMGWGVTMIQWLAACVAQWPWAQSAVPAMPAWGLCCVMFGLACLCLWRGAGRWAGAVPLVLGLASICVEKPLLLVAPDAGVVAVRDGAALRVGPVSGLDRSVLADWTQALALPVQPLPEACREGLCRLSVGGRMFLLRVSGRVERSVLPSAEMCRDVVLFVSASPARGACPGVERIDRFSVWRDGAFTVYPSSDGIRLVSGRMVQGVRPWVPPPGWRGMPTLPLAPAE
ncbi:ComEC/Rec2 family competence protein [Neokomagataea thailandica]|uniref:ComEC/Rec2 family competence protein n=1 Tax=Neokomagataea TaxID=1223423 RepID=UPI001FE14066|nr:MULTISPECIES: ComEC/Rec2 family competence protein [Neokomagataea]